MKRLYLCLFVALLATSLFAQSDFFYSKARRRPVLAGQSGKGDCRPESPARGAPGAGFRGAGLPVSGQCALPRGRPHSGDASAAYRGDINFIIFVFYF